MSKTKDALMRANQDRTALTGGTWYPPKEKTEPDMLDHAIQKWMEFTGDNGSDARVKIATLAMKELSYMSQCPRQEAQASV